MKRTNKSITSPKVKSSHLRVHFKSLKTLELINDQVRRINGLITFQLALIASISDRVIKGTKIPAIIHQSWKTKDIKHGMSRLGSLVWKSRAKKVFYLLWDDDDIAHFIQTLYPSLNQLFQKLPAILKADLFRYLVVYDFGGIYSDIDTIPLKPLESWMRPLESWKIPYTPQDSSKDLKHDRHDHFSWKSDKKEHDIAFIVGLETDLAKNCTDKIILQNWAYPLQLCQWTFASAPGYTVLAKIINSIIKCTKGKTIKQLSKLNVIDTTGPGAWTRAIYESWKEFGFDPNDLREFGSSPRTIKDQLILPLTAFNPGMSWKGIGKMGSMPENHPNSLVKHLYLGSWKT